MNEFGWRTLVIESHCDLSLENQNIRISGADVTMIPLCQLREIIVNTLEVSITSALLVKLNELNISVVFCNSKRNPCIVMDSLEDNRRFSSSLYKQIEWTDEKKKSVWKAIIRQKISNQISVLEAFEIKVPGCMYEYRTAASGEKCNACEASAARVYFKQLFGNSFRRHTDDDLNSALNYGYSLLLSSFNRILSVHGYNTCLGINHCNETNPFNLSCDLMEPFRQFVDIIVFQNRNMKFDGDYKKLLVQTVFQSTVRYDNKTMKIQDAMELYVDDVLSLLNGTNSKKMKEVRL